RLLLCCLPVQSGPDEANWRDDLQLPVVRERSFERYYSSHPELAAQYQCFGADQTCFTSIVLDRGQPLRLGVLVGFRLISLTRAGNLGVCSADQRDERKQRRQDESYECSRVILSMHWPPPFSDLRARCTPPHVVRHFSDFFINHAVHVAADAGILHGDVGPAQNL